MRSRYYFYSMPKPSSRKILTIINSVLLVSLLGTFGINQIIISKIRSNMGVQAFASFRSMNTAKALTGNIGEDTVSLIVSRGVPDVYGAELGVSFDGVQGSIDILKQFDPTYGNKKISLSGENLQRYVAVGTRISCEYCCGAKAIVHPNGQAACGCAHSWAMRGLAAYLIANHGAEYSNDEILRELSRWKGMFFPKQMIQKLSTQLQGGEFTPDIASLLIGLDLPKYGQGGKAVPLPSDIENLPGMVGGC